MAVYFHFFDLESHPSCRYDKLDISDSQGNIQTFCGNRTGAIYLGKGQYVNLNLKTDRVVSKQGYDLYFVPVDAHVFASGVWATFAGLRDPSLRELASRLESTVIASRATGTTDAYRRAFLRWRSFGASSDEIQAFPAKPEHVALYLQHVLDTTKSHSSMDSAIYGIQWAHNLADVPSPTNSY
ncbi:uncharacterized protein [Acropora muricata]